MKLSLRATAAAVATVTGLSLAPAALSHFDDEQPMQSYRQSYFALLAANFGPMVAMVKGEMPWDDQKMKGFASDFEGITELNIMRGFAPGTEKGTTRAKPEIWNEIETFKQKFIDLQAAATELDDTVENGGDRKAIGAAVAKTGQTCKACHDDYKSKDYLY